MILRDWTDRSPASYVLRERQLEEIRAAVLHQTSFEWAEENAMWALVRAHFAVHRSGLITQLHPITARMLYGCGAGNRWAINIECEGNLPLEYRDGVPVYWRPEKYGRSVLTPAQVEAGRELLASLAEQVPGLMVGTHRQIEMNRSGCCGPDIWREIGQHAVGSGMPEMPLAGGRPIPDAWRGANYSEIPISSVRAYDGPLEVPL